MLALKSGLFLSWNLTKVLSWKEFELLFCFSFLVLCLAEFAKLWNFSGGCNIPMRDYALHLKPAKNPVDWWGFCVIWFIYSWMLFSVGRSLCTECVLCYKCEIQTWGLMWNILRVKENFIPFLTRTCALSASNMNGLCWTVKKKKPPWQTLMFLNVSSSIWTPPFFVFVDLSIWWCYWSSRTVITTEI